MIEILHVSNTPNPLARKFHASELLTHGIALSFPDRDSALEHPAALALFGLPAVRGVFVLDQVVTVSLAPTGDWDELEHEVKMLLEDYLEPAQALEPLAVEQVQLDVPQDFFALELEEQVNHLERIFDLKVRPGLAKDGGGLQLMGIDGQTVYIYYLGACGSCPSSTTGTLNFIRQILREWAHPQIEVELA